MSPWASRDTLCGSIPCASGIVEVWQDNVSEVVEELLEIAEECKTIAVHVDFPGYVGRPCAPFSGAEDYNYQRLRCNVNLLKAIRISLAFTNEDGEPPVMGASAFRFNFNFSLTSDLYAQDAVDVLKAKGVDFGMLELKGIDHATFGELMMSSGLVLSEDVHWVSCNCAEDMSFLLRILTGEALPSTCPRFMESLFTYFPKTHDLKHLLASGKVDSAGVTDKKGLGSSGCLNSESVCPCVVGVDADDTDCILCDAATGSSDLSDCGQPQRGSGRPISVTTTAPGDLGDGNDYKSVLCGRTGSASRCGMAVAAPHFSEGGASRDCHDFGLVGDVPECVVTSSIFFEGVKKNFSDVTKVKHGVLLGLGGGVVVADADSDYMRHQKYQYVQGQTRSDVQQFTPPPPPPPPPRDILPSLSGLVRFGDEPAALVPPAM